MRLYQYALSAPYPTYQFLSAIAAKKEFPPNLVQLWREKVQDIGYDQILAALFPHLPNRHFPAY